MPNKLTDAEIKKALECCAINSSCTDCPLRKTKSNCGDYFLDLFNRKDAEIESLKAEVERLKEEVKKEQFYNLRMTAYSVKAEAYKEFAERLKLIILWSPKNHISITAKDIDNILNELVGDAK